MRCFGITRKAKRCKNSAQFVFCNSHKLQWWGIILIIATVGGLYQDVFKPSYLSVVGWFGSSRSVETTESSNKPIFSPKDSISFNILILNFEDYIAKKETNCIGRAIQENLNNLSANDSLALSLNIKYPETIVPPRSKEAAEKILNRHNGDLLIYGLARKVIEDCAGAELAFRFMISKAVIAKVNPAISIKSFDHDSRYHPINTIDIEQDSLKVNTLSLKKWTKALINLKAEKPNEAFLELDDILQDTRDMLQLGTKMINGEKHITFKEISNRKNRYSSIGKTYFDLKLYEKSLVVFDTAISLYPEESVFYQNRGAIYAILKQYDKSLHNLDSAIALNPMDAVAYSNRGGVKRILNKNTEALEDLNRAIKLDSNLTYPYLQKGILFFNIGQYEKAIVESSYFIDLDSTNAYAYNVRGAAHAKSKKYDLSIKDFKNSIELEPRNLEALYNFASTYALAKKYDSSITIINRAISLNPNDSKSYGHKGVILSEMGKYKKSIPFFDKTIKKDSFDAFVYNNRAFSLLKLNRISDARKDLQKSKSLDNTNGWVYRNMACYYLLNNKNNQAISHLEKAISLGYEDINWMQTEVFLNPIRGTKEFERLMEKLKYQIE